MLWSSEGPWLLDAVTTSRNRKCSNEWRVGRLPINLTSRHLRGTTSPAPSNLIQRKMGYVANGFVIESQPGGQGTTGMQSNEGITKIRM